MRIHRFRPTHRKNSLFLKVLIIVGIVQAALLMALAGVLVTQSIIPQEQKFESAPKPVQTQEPEQQKRRVITKNLQKRSNQMPRRINVARVQNVRTPEVNISLPSGMGGADVGGMFSTEGLSNLQKISIDLPTLDLFNTKATSDRVFIIFECSEETMRDDMGGLDAYLIVKGEIKKLVNSLPSACLFNIAVFDTHSKQVINMCYSSLVPASAANKEKFAKWMDNINKDEKHFGLQWRDNNYKLRFPGPPNAVYIKDFSFHGDSWQRDGIVFRYQVYQAAIEQRAGAVWILTREWPEPNQFFIPPSDEQIKKFNQKWKDEIERQRKRGKIVGGAKEWNDWVKAIEPAKQKAAAWLEAENKRREAKGIPKRVQSDMLALAGELKIPFPGRPLMASDLRPQIEFKRYSAQTLRACYEPILKKIYDESDLPRPTVNMIILQRRGAELSTKQRNMIRSWARWNNGGNYRILRAGKPVKEYESN